MEGLHIEMALESALGNLLQDSGWVESLEDATITTAGRSESLLTGSFVKRTRYGDEVTLCALYLLLLEAYESDNEITSLEAF